VSDVPCAVGSMPCAIPENTHGYEVEEAEVTYWGTCPSCARARPSTTTR
jgi:Fe2+ or Zn2+ uptake regulation protein